MGSPDDPPQGGITQPLSSYWGENGAFVSGPAPGAWSPLAALPAHPTNRLELVPDPGWTTQRFYRVRIP